MNSLSAPAGRPTTPTAGRPAPCPPGWRPESWRSRLLALADACEPYHAERATELRRMAQGLNHEDTKTPKEVLSAED
jgi:hypothetical protein